MRHVSKDGLALAKRAALVCPSQSLCRATSNPFEALNPHDGAKRANCIAGVLIIQALKPHTYPLLTVRHSVYYGLTGLISSHWLGASSFGEFVHIGLGPEVENRRSYAERYEAYLRNNGEIEELTAKAAYLRESNPVEQIEVLDRDGEIEIHRIALTDADLLLDHVANGRTMEELKEIASAKLEQTLRTVL
ncbi:MAG: hypothetical protein H6799_02730 [Candidatus Nomurabacteria bacterium]|nr:MAG: hypothetical protein H6799_02730 [Candidatus Nomurabacteria bacterium]HRV75836.1 hypothetical protein [Candidatus Saccharimonadales bacterium]